MNGNGDSRPGLRNVADDSGNSRGLGNVDKTRNYFLHDDRCRLLQHRALQPRERRQRRAVRSWWSAGTAESSLLRANLTRNRQKLTLRADSYGSERTVLDLSQVIIPRSLALRLATLRENKEFFIRPGYETKPPRLFLAATYQPFKNTTLRLEAGYVHRRDARPPTTMARDNGYLHWLASQRAGNPRV